MDQPKALPGAGQLIGDAWKLYASKWNEHMKTAGLIIVVALIDFLLLLALKYYPNEQMALGLVSIAVIANGVFFHWIYLRIILRTFRLEAGKAPSEDESGQGWKYFFPALWVMVLITLATLGGYILFIIPGIYLATALSFSLFALLDQDVRSTKALSASYKLVKDRWWSVFWRALAAGFVFGLLMQIVLLVVQLVVGLITGPMPEQLTTIQDLLGNTHIIGGQLFAQLAVTALYIPLMVGFMVKLYRALKETR